MARCMLCSTPAADTDVVCARCGGALEDEGPDPTQVAAVDLTKADGPPEAWPGQPPAAAEPSPWGAAPQPSGPPSAQWGAAGGPSPGPWGSPPGPPAGQWGPASGGPGPYGAPPGVPPYGAPPVPYGYGGPGWGTYAPPTPTDGLAIGSLVTSLVGLVTASFCLVPILACPVGAVLGHVAMRRIDQNGSQGRGIALAGVIIGWLGTALLVIGTAAVVAAAVASS